MNGTLKNGITGGVPGFVISFLFNYFIILFPGPETANAIGNGMSGLIGGCMSGFIGIMVHTA